MCVWGGGDGTKKNVVHAQSIRVSAVTGFIYVLRAGMQAGGERGGPGPLIRAKDVRRGAAKGGEKTARVDAVKALIGRIGMTC